VTLPPGCPRLSRLSGEALDAELLARAQRYPLAAGDEEIVARALAYPYVPPHESYVLGDPVLDGRHRVLAYGANGSPEVLRRKLGPDVELAVQAQTLHGFELVYSAHISAYGAIPATIHAVPGAAIPVFVLLLDDHQLVRLAETEFNYSIQRLGGDLIAFVSRHGTLGLTGEPIRLADRGQRELQALVREHVAPGESEEEFILRNVRDHARALRFTIELRRTGIPFSAEGAELLDV
jgi:hypothetical protein